MTTTVDGNSGGTAITDSTITGYVPSGVVFPFAGASTPAGFLLCYGQAVSRTTYANLFAAIGTTHGSGDGSTTFNVPDLRGRSMFGKDDMGGSAANRVTNGGSGIVGTTLGAVGGSQYMQSHNHTGGGAGLVGNNLYNGTSRAMGTADGTNSGYFQDIQIYTNNTGSGSSQNMPPAIIMNFIIKT